MKVNHISVCICTYKRSQLLVRLLTALEEQTTDDLFTYSIVVADNDRDESARPIVAHFSSTSRVPAIYCNEPEKNIALVRNRVLEHADGEFIAFIDDDETPIQEWLVTLLKAYRLSGVDGVLGPVNPYFECEPPRWAKKGKFFDRPSHPTRYKLTWAECRTGNVFFRRNILDALDVPFRSEFGTAGEDMDFFRRLIDKGYAFSWCAEAVVNELVPSIRCSRTFLLKRALLRGSNFPKHPAHRLRNVLKSIIAVPSYTLALPILVAFGEHVFLRYLIKLCDHVSRLLAFAGWSLIKERET